jgi:large subunit ribosomal protein L7/L12
MAEAPGKEFSPAIKETGDRILSMTLIQCTELLEYLKEHGVEPPAGGAIMMAAAPGAAAAGAPAAAEEKTEFTLILKSAGDKKLPVIKVVRAARADLGLKEAKALVDEAPKPLLEGANKQDVEKWKKELEAAGATVEIQ